MNFFRQFLTDLPHNSGEDVAVGSGWAARRLFEANGLSAMGLSKQYAGTYAWGFFLFAALALAMLAMLRAMQLRWTHTA